MAAATSAATLLLLPLQAAAHACGPRFVAPSPGVHATSLNGVVLDRVCYGKPGPQGHHVFVIGDWGGPLPEPGEELSPADNTKLGSPRRFVEGVDDKAGRRVAEAMGKRAALSNPDYVLNVGDAFYWGGIQTTCGRPPFQHFGTGQWGRIFETVYTGPGLDNKQWLGVLGNHDYGGFHFTNAWDQQIGYTWTGPTGRWVMPAQYWAVRAAYPDFSVDYYFLDSNDLVAWHPDVDEEHNICGRKHNPEGASCGTQGPEDLRSCQGWFQELWRSQETWLETLLNKSEATWQVVVTHFPPDLKPRFWREVSRKHGIDLIVSGHRHAQELHGPEDASNFLRPSAYLVSGGGGGITSENVPNEEGHDDMYGFMDLTLSRESIEIEAVSHGGQLRKRRRLLPRAPGGKAEEPTGSREERARSRDEEPDESPLRSPLRNPLLARQRGAAQDGPPRQGKSVFDVFNRDDITIVQ